MPRRSSSLSNLSPDVAVAREISSSYDTVKAVAENLENVTAVGEAIVDGSIVDLMDNIVDIVAIGNEVAEIVVVSDNIDDVNIVATNVVSVNTAAANIPNIIAVGSNITNVNIAATNLSAINTAATNIEVIQGAAQNAADTGVDASATAADVVLTHADVTTTNADVVLTHTDAIITHADVELTNTNVALAEADKIQTNLDRVAVASDLVATNQDTADTAADRVQTGLDSTQTGLDSSQTALDRLAVAADLVQTALDMQATAANRIQTGLDFDQTALDRIQTGSDRTQTGLDRIATGNDKTTTNADVILTHADVVIAEADKVQTGLDRVQTGLDRVQTVADRVQTGLDATAATNQASIATARASEASASADFVDDLFLGAKASDPATDNDGGVLQEGAIYYNTTLEPKQLKIWNGSQWNQAVFDASGAVLSFNGRDGIVVLNASDINTALGFTAIELTKSNVESLNINSATVNSLTVETAVPTGAIFTDTNTWRSVIDNLTSTNPSSSLSANQGRVLKGLIDTIENTLLSDNLALDSFQEVVDFIEQNKSELDTLGISNIAGLQNALNGKVDAGQVLTNVPSGAKFTDTVYTHPIHAGDDINIDTLALSGATVISDLDFNVTTDTQGHVTDANASIATRTLTLANLGYTGETNATADQSDAEILAAVKRVDINGASGLNAGTFDNLGSGSFLRSDASDTISTSGESVLSIEGGTNLGGLTYYKEASVESGMKIGYDGSANLSYMDNIFNNVAHRAWTSDRNSNVIKFTATPTVAGSTVWHGGNDGAGSGLDADKLDSLQSTQFVRSDIANEVTAQLTVDNTGKLTSAYSWTNSAIQATSLEIIDSNTNDETVCPTLFMHNYGDGGVKIRMGNTGDKTLYFSSGQGSDAGRPTDNNGGTYFNAMKLNNNLIYHAGNIPTWNQSTTGNATTATRLLEIGDHLLNNVEYSPVWENNSNTLFTSTANYTYNPGKKRLTSINLRATEALELGAAQAEIKYNSTDNSIDFIIN